MSPTEFVIVLTTLPASHDASAFARTLVGERLAACVSILPEGQSVYSWKGSIEDDRERQLVIKTRRACLDALAARVAGLHPYEVPEWLVLPVAAGSDAYLGWIAEVTVGPSRPAG